jgi:hypothetical protein
MTFGNMRALGATEALACGDGTSTDCPARLSSRRLDRGIPCSSRARVPFAISDGISRPVLDTSHDSYSDRWVVLDSVQIRSAHNARVICRPTCAESVHSEEIDTPMRRTPFRSGNCAASNSALIDANVERSEIGARHDRLRVMI